MIYSFIICLLIFLGIGLYSARVRKNTRQDYYLASLSVPPWLVGLSAMATNNSGYMFIGLVGFTYTIGLASIWLMVGWIFGDLIVSFLIHKPLREQTESQNQLSYAGVISNWDGIDYQYVRKMSAVLIIVLLLTYASAQMVAGSKALHVLLNWPIASGAIVSAIMIALYCFVGGIRASIWTDAAQSIVMILAMAVMLWTGFDAMGGINNSIEKWSEIDSYLSWFPLDSIIPGITGAFLFTVGWLFGGISIIGQPHIMIRFMMLDNSDNFIQARVWYYSWYTVFYLMAIGVGLLSRLLIPEQNAYDPELALPLIAKELLHPVFVGLVLAGLFAATMSTADSLILSCSAAITQDLKDKGIESLMLVKGTTIIVTVIALLFALIGSQNVFNIVMFSWSGLGSCFAPLLIVYAIGERPSQALAMTMMCSGLLIAVIWRLLDWHVHVYEGMPGILTGLLVYAVFSVSYFFISNREDIKEKS